MNRRIVRLIGSFIVLVFIVIACSVDSNVSAQQRRRTKPTPKPKPSPTKTETQENSSVTQPQNNEPTLAETLEFLKGKIDGVYASYETVYTDYKSDYTATSTYGVNFQNQIIDFSNGKFELKYKYSQYHSHKYKSNTSSYWDNSYSNDTFLITNNGSLNQFSYKEITVSPCSKQSENTTYKGNCFRVYIATFNNSKVVSSKVTNREYKTRSATSEKDIPEKIEKKDDETGMGAGVSIYFWDEETANRVAKAFAHAIKLSGGKSEVF